MKAIMTDDTPSNPSKKRKANDGRAATAVGGGGFLSSLFGYYFSGPPHDTSTGHDGNNNTNNDQFMQQTLSRMEQSMLRMEEKLGTLSTIKRRCSSLENQVSTLQSTVDKLVKKNQSWEYSVDIDSFDWLDNEDEAGFLLTTATALREKTIKLRAGVFPDTHVLGANAISLDGGAAYDCGKILPHWIEFAAALMQFNPSTNNDDDSFFELCRFLLNKPTLKLIKEALIGKAFKKMRFNLFNDYESGGLSMDEILDVMESNKHLRHLGIQSYNIRGHHVEKFCSIVHNNPLLQIYLFDSCHEPGVGNAILANLLARRDSKLEILCMHDNGITSNVCTVLVDFLAANSKLQELGLEDNHLNDSDAAQIARALRSNTTLKRISLSGNNISHIGVTKAFGPLIFNDSSLNAAADSNHSCYLYYDGLGHGSHPNLNIMKARRANRRLKIFHLLSSRHKTMSNTQHFSDMDVKILPKVLDSIQRYGIFVQRYNDSTGIYDYDYDAIVGSLSIVYEVMRKWEKVFCLFE